MKYLYTSLFSFFFMGIVTVNAQKWINTEGSPFEIVTERNIGVKWKGKLLLCSDSLSWAAGKTVGDQAGTVMVTRDNGWQTVNVWDSNFVAPFRREIGLSPDRKKVELTFQIHHDALMEEYPSPQITYKICVPDSMLENSTWDALTGRSENARWIKGNFDASMPNGNITTSTRWITFNTPEGSITFDFNPHGVTTYYVAGINTMVSQWNVAKKGSMVELSISTSTAHYGGDFTSKFTIFEGNKDDYTNHHAATYYHYFSELLNEKLFCFNDKSGKDFINAGVSKYDPAVGYGWKNPEGLTILGGANSGALYASCISLNPNTFITNGLRPGLYLITVKSSALYKKQGPFSVIFNEEQIYDDIAINKNHLAEITFVRWIDGGIAEITFEGEWAVSVIGFQLFMHNEEDFQFRRGNWLKKDSFCPGILFANYYDTPPVYGKALTYLPLAGKINEVAEIPQFPELGTELPDQYANELAWRFKSPLGTMGPSNWGTFNEFNTPDKITKRLYQLKNSGVDAIILNGFLSRHTYAIHLERVKENIRHTVEKAHQMGMKIIDHQDLTILWNADMGFRFLAENPGYLQHNHTNGLPTWGLCPINHGFKYGYFFPYISDHIKKTNIDGLMLDETNFHYANFCSCPHCRKSFTDITGLVLPDDETSPLLHNKSSKLWKTWIEWRKYALTQWRLDLSALTHQIDPNFSNLEYYSERGFLTNDASYEQGGDLPLYAKSKDFLGTEIMSRDVWDDYRYNFTSRNMYNSLRETYGSPIFGLVYPGGVFNYAIMGWAMNNMFGQVTWSLANFKGKETMNPYTGWQKNMNKITSVPYTDIAIVFSRMTRDWSLKNTGTYPKEVMGTGQFMVSRHIPHTFILDDAIVSQELSKYRVLLAPGMDCVSDEQENILKQFIFDGGTLFLTGDAGLLTPYGDIRDRRTFNDILTENRLVEAMEKDWVVMKYGKGKLIYTQYKSMINEFCPSIRETGMIYNFTPDPNITALNEKIIENVVGAMIFKSISIPPKVLVTTYKDTEKGQECIMVHLLNATGVKAKHGDSLPLPNPLWEPINEDINFEISLPSPRKAYYTSPDVESDKEIDIKKIGKNRYFVKIPKGTVDKYGIVYFLPKL